MEMDIFTLQAAFCGFASCDEAFQSISSAILLIPLILSKIPPSDRKGMGSLDRINGINRIGKSSWISSPYRLPPVASPPAMG